MQYKETSSAALARLASICLATSGLTFLGVDTAMAAVIDYPNGSDNASPIVLTDNSTQLQVLTGTATQSGAISDGGNLFGLEKIGNGTLILAGSNNYNGQTTISAGALSIANDASLGNGGLTLNGGTIAVTSPIFSTRAVTLASGGGTFDIAAGSIYTIADGAIGSGELTKTGLGTLLLGGAAAYSGPTLVSAGTLTTDGGIYSGSMTVASGATLNVESSTVAGSLAGSGNVLLNSSVNGNFSVGNDNGTSTFSGAISGVGSLTKVGSGTLILTGSDASTTVVTAGTLQIGNGGTAGTITGSIVDNSALAFSRSDTISYGGIISGTGNVAINQGTVIFTNSGTGSNVINSYTGGTVIASGATLQLGTTGTVGVGMPNGSVVNNGHLVVNHILASNIESLPTSIISGTGDVTITGGAFEDLNPGNSYSGNTYVTSGSFIRINSDHALGAASSTLLLGDAASTGTLRSDVPVTLAAQRQIVVGAGGATLNGRITVPGLISGSGQLTTSAFGQTLILLGNNTYTGGTQVVGTLQLGNGGTVGGIIGNVAVNSATFNGITSGLLVFDRSDNVIFSGTISGNGGVSQMGTGTLTLSGVNTYTGATTVGAGGTLSVTGSTANSNTNVASGGKLTGIGKVGATNIASGGTFSPGVGTPGVLTVAGNLSLASGATYVENFSPSSASLATVAGSASLSGNLLANAAAGTYSVGQRYTILTAMGGVTGNFTSLTTTGLSDIQRGLLSYDSNDVFLTIVPNALSPSLPAGATSNQRTIVEGIDAALQSGVGLSSGFAPLMSFSGSALGGALNQLSGEIGSDASQAAAQALAPFLDLLTQANGSDSAVVTGLPEKIKPAQLEVGATRIWASAYGGHSTFGAGAITGAQHLSAGAVGAAAGVETQLNDDFLMGVSLAGGSETFSLAGSQSQGISSDIMLGGYAREAVLDHGYLSGALVYGWHNVGTQRVVTVSGADILSSKFVADDFAGRAEGGYSFALDGQSAMTPYIALAGDDYSSPAYGESARSGASTFALSYGERDSGRVRSELGARLGRDLKVEDDTVTVELHAAWAHQIQDDVTGQASFQNLAGATFAVSSVTIPQDSALLGLAMQVKSPGGMSGGVRIESQFGAGLSAVFGTANIGYSW